MQNDMVKHFYRINMYKKGFYVYRDAYDRLKKRQQNVVTYVIEKRIKFGNVIFFTVWGTKQNCKHGKS